MYEEICSLSFIPSTTADIHPPLFFFSLVKSHSFFSLQLHLPNHHSFLLQRPPTHFTFCCEYSGLNELVLYLAGRCAITLNHLDHSCTLGLRCKACHFLTSCLIFLSLLLLSYKTKSDAWTETAIIWLDPYPGFSDITCCTCITIWVDKYSELKHTVWVFITHTSTVRKACV